MWEKEIAEGVFSLVSPIPLDHQLLSSTRAPAWGRQARKNGMCRMKMGFGGRGDKYFAFGTLQSRLGGL
jgi:hypothetical protein